MSGAQAYILVGPAKAQLRSSSATTAIGAINPKRSPDYMQTKN